MLAVMHQIKKDEGEKETSNSPYLFDSALKIYSNGVLTRKRAASLDEARKLMKAELIGCWSHEGALRIKT